MAPLKYTVWRDEWVLYMFKLRKDTARIRKKTFLLKQKKRRENEMKDKYKFNGYRLFVL